MLDKTLEDTNTYFELALSWSANAKNSLTNVYGFSPFQLALVQHPSLQSVFHEKAPLLWSGTTSKILTYNNLLLRKAHQTYMAI